MIKFDFTNIINGATIPNKFKDICDLSYELSAQTMTYIENMRELTDGLTPSEGFPIYLYGDYDPYGIMGNLQRVYNHDMAEIYSVQAFQLLLASGAFPLAWLMKTKPDCYNSYFKSLYSTWNFIVLDSYNIVRGPLYPHIKSFGLMTRLIEGHKSPDLVFFVIYDNQVDYNFLQDYLNNEPVPKSTIAIMDEREYTKCLLNETQYKFLFKFDKVESQMSGITFKGTTKLIEKIPSYSLEIGCDNACVIYREVDEAGNHNAHFKNVEFKKGSSITTTLYVPSDYSIEMVVFNGTTYFKDTPEMDAIGISILETTMITMQGYKTYNITTPVLMNNAKMYIKSCKDMTGTGFTKNIVSTKSNFVVDEEDVTINLIFTKPFIFFDNTKVKVYARKDDNSEEELVTPISIITDGYKYVERKAVFAKHIPNKSFPDKHKPMKPFGDPQDIMRGQNPYVTDNRKPKDHLDLIYKEPKITDNYVIYSVNECGSVILTFDGYTDYKYFRVTFEDRAMISVFNVIGMDRHVDTIPVINDILFTNIFIKEPDDDIIEEEPKDDNTEESPDNTENPTPDDKDNNGDQIDDGGGSTPDPEEDTELDPVPSE